MYTKYEENQFAEFSNKTILGEILFIGSLFEKYD